MTAEHVWTWLLRGLATIASAGFVLAALGVFTPWRITSIVPEVVAFFAVLALVPLSFVARIWQFFTARSAAVPVTYERATRLGALAVALFIAHLVTEKSAGFSSTSYELTRVRGRLEDLQRRQSKHLADSGRYAATLEALAMPEEADSVRLTFNLITTGYQAVGYAPRYGGRCALTHFAPADGGDEFGYPECDVGSRENKGIIPDLPLFLVAAAACAWIALGKPAKTSPATPPLTT